VKVHSGLIRKWLLGYLFLSLGAIVIILVLTVGKRGWSEFFDFNFWYIIPIVLAVTGRWVFESLGMKVLIDSGSNLSINLWQTMRMRLECTFASISVPVIVGTSMFQVYLLTKKRLSVGESVSITAIRDVLPLLILFLSIPVFLLLGFRGGERFFVIFVRVAALPIFLIFLFFVLTFFQPDRIKKLISGVLNLFERRHWIKTEKIHQLKKTIHQDVDILSDSLKLYIIKRKRILLIAALCFLGMFLMEFSVAYFIMKGLGFHPAWMHSYTIQFFLKSILCLAPSPGGSGFNEFGYMGFFSIFLPNHLVGGSVLLWRFFNAYFPVIVGGVLLMKDLRSKKIVKPHLQQKSP
jgi:uncharacterized protein (TIRG00374 family)